VQAANNDNNEWTPSKTNREHADLIVENVIKKLSFAHLMVCIDLLTFY
jgi:hypothetical protein